MELWIRSQDKNFLEKAVMVNISQIPERKFGSEKEIITFKYGVVVNNNYVYGEYKTQKRALEVLDEIQKYLVPELKMLDETLNGKQVCQINNILSIIYQMPEK